MAQAREYRHVEQAEDPAGDWLSNSRSTLLVVITLITTLSFQAGVNPPGGFWQDDSQTHTAGDAIMKQKNPKRYAAFTFASWLCFYYSLLLLVWLLTGVVTPKSPVFKVYFLSCIAMLVFLFQASLTDAHLPGSFALMALMGVWTGCLLCKGKKKKDIALESTPSGQDANVGVDASENV